MRRHLAACWQCRAELESLEATVADCMRYRKQALAAHLPEAPNPWPDLQRGFERIDAELAAGPFWKRLARIPRRWQWTLAAAAAAAVLAAVLFQLQETPSVQAAALLKKAVAAADARPTTHARRLLIRTSHGQTARAGGTASAAMPAAVSALFETAHYDSQDPLSARAFQSWRDSVPEKTDDVTTVPDPQTPSRSCYQIRTAPAAGAVSTATLTLRTADLRPVEGKLEFRDRDWIEFTEVSESSAKDDAAVAANSVEIPVRPAEPSRPAAAVPRSTASISDELQVLSALHRIGADLGDPVEVTRADGRVLVGGIGIAPQRQSQIHALLDGMPHVTVEFASPDAAAPAPAEAATQGIVAGDAGNPRIQARLERQLGGRAQWERFTSRLLDASEAAMSHAYALRSLAERFPAGEEQAMSAGDHELLNGMAREHLASLSAQAEQIAGALEPALKGLGGSLPAAQAQSTPAAWQPAATELFGAARRVEVLLSELLGVTPAGQSTADLPSQLLAASRDLKMDLDQCQKLVRQGTPSQEK